MAETVGDAPSTYHITLPEIYLDTPEEDRRVQQIRAHMQDYLDRDLFVEHEGFILVERTVGGKTRYGLMLALDLEQYDYNKGSTSLIRATEGTILERIPPRVRIRSGAPLELPHILVLIDDPAAHGHRTAGRRPRRVAQAVRFRADARQRPSARLFRRRPGA